jgi:beta-glucanase (GH16 family)
VFICLKTDSITACLKPLAHPPRVFSSNKIYFFIAAYTIGERFIPIEPMYMIWNLGMSQDFGEVDIENLPFPSYMMVDWIRVYQRPGSLNVGCSPPEMPTAQWINCHKDLYKTSNKDDILFGTCTSGATEKTRISSLVAVAVIVTTTLLMLLV